MNYTTATTTDGFGAQYQRIIQTYIFCKFHNYNFLYKPFSFIEHNYNNDNNYIYIIENLVNLNNNIKKIENLDKIIELDYNSIVRPFFEKNIDLCCESIHMKFIKNCFWQNKNKNFFKNDKINIAIHIRRANSHDKGQAGERVTTPNSYYLNVINLIRKKYKDKNLLFHIYSQGNIQNFIELYNNDVLFYLNHNIIETFIGMVSAEILVISPSSLSYVAALISDGEIYYKPFWHTPRNNWNIIKN